jgi:hypothetical protein
MAFAHSGQAQDYNSTDLQLLKKYSMVQFDKKQGIASSPQLSTEDRMIIAAKQVKVVNAEAQILLYINGLINFPASRLFNMTASRPSLFLKNTEGKQVKLVGHTVFDMRQAAMRKLFVDDALYGMDTGAFNGVFIDRANWAEKCATTNGWDKATCSSLVPGQVSIPHTLMFDQLCIAFQPSPSLSVQRQLFVELTAALGEGNITLAKETSSARAVDWQVANAAMTSDTFCSAYWYDCSIIITNHVHS